MRYIRRYIKLLQNLPNLLLGYNIYVNKEKFALIDYAFKTVMQKPQSFADLGGVWNVNAAYSRYALNNYTIKQAFLVDTNFTTATMKKIAKYKNLTKIQGDFSHDEIIKKISQVDAVFMFDVLLHQVKPDWDQVLEKYTQITDCFIIYNQQMIGKEASSRLTDLSIDAYKKIVPVRRDSFYETIYAKGQEIHPEYHKPWKDIHNIWQWGITDHDLRNKMSALGYEEFFYKNYGRFANLMAFENHAFVFIRKGVS